MRLLSSLIATVLASSSVTVAPRPAAACGSYADLAPAPQLLVVSSHGVHGPGERSRQRAFVVVDDPFDAPDPDRWAMLAPATYDATQIAALAPRRHAMQVTLVGPSGRKVVRTSRRVALSHDFHLPWNTTHAALEVPVGITDRFAIALPGRVAAAWHELDYVDAAGADRWLADRGITASPSVARIAGTSYEVVAFTANGASQLIVRDGTRVLRHRTGDAIGAVTIDGRLFLVTRAEHRLATIALPSPTRT